MSPNFQSPCNFVSFCQLSHPRFICWNPRASFVSFFQLSHPRFIVGTLGLVCLFYLDLVELKQGGDL